MRFLITHPRLNGALLLCTLCPFAFWDGWTNSERHARTPFIAAAAVVFVAISLWVHHVRDRLGEGDLEERVERGWADAFMGSTLALAGGGAIFNHAIPYGAFAGLMTGASIGLLVYGAPALRINGARAERRANRDT